MNRAETGVICGLFSKAFIGPESLVAFLLAGATIFAAMSVYAFLINKGVSMAKKNDLGVKITRKDIEGHQVVIVDGPLKSGTEFDFDEVLSEAESKAKKPPSVIIDMTKCPFMNSASLGMLLNTHRRISDKHGLLVLVGISKDVEDLIKITRLSTIFHIEMSLVDAQRAIEEMTA
jgi:anti-anti-sigma factor